MAATIGQAAPDFTLTDQDNNKVSLADLRGQKALVVFIPFPFSSICQAELCEIRDDLSNLAGLGAKVVVITVGSRHVLQKWAEEQKFAFPVLSDFWPHGAVAQAYGCFNDQLGVATRATYVLDATGTVRAIVQTDSIGQARAHEEYAKALSSF